MRFSTFALWCVIFTGVSIVGGCGRTQAPQASGPQGASTPTPGTAVPSTPVPGPTPLNGPAVGQPALDPTTMAGRLATAQEIALIPDGTELSSPESGKVIQKNAMTPALVYGGRLYFFCCSTSMERCQADPRLLQGAQPPNG
jgi:hypothetical protein